MDFISALERVINKAIDKSETLVEGLLQTLQAKFWEDSPSIRKLLEKTENFYVELEALKKGDFTAQEAYDLKEKYAPLFKQLHQSDLVASNPKVDRFIRSYINIDSYRRHSNTPQRTMKKQLAHNLLSNIDGKALDEQQQDAVVCDEENTLVIAGAGSGKTLTIAGKVVYLVKNEQVKPEEILLITYTRKAAEEMEERIVKRLQIPVEVKTFHGLGSDILAEVSGQKAAILDQNYFIVEQYFGKKNLEQSSIMQKIIIFLGQYWLCPPVQSQFKSLGECYDSQKSLDMRTLKDLCERANEKADKMTFKGEKVKSTEELQLANFFYLNGITYMYEKPYPHPTADQQHRQYIPDFYLPDVDLYIEHFGVDRQGNNNWYTEIENKKYQEGMIWKRNLHQQMKTKLYETYSYQFNEGNVFEILERDLKVMGVKFKPIDMNKVYECLESKENKHFKEFKKLMRTFLNLFKSQNYGLEKLDEMSSQIKSNPNIFMRQRNMYFLELFKGLYVYYENYLKQNNSIDFSDMINKATQCVKEGAIGLSYRYIIIDEYQDIAYSRYALVKAIKEQTGAKLMAVGDDWQSIYRFAGSDMSLFTSFEKLFGVTDRIYIEKTYRNSQELIDIAGQFVQRNPMQIQKQLKSDQHLKMPIRLIGYQQDIQKALLHTLRKISYQSEVTEVLLLGRNNFDLNSITGNKQLVFHTTKEGTSIQYLECQRLRIRFLTVHKAKGLQADAVILLNCKNDLLGFPNQMNDDPLLDLVMTEGDYYRYGEERRLFYVALTRTKGYTYLLVPEKNPSIFVRELMDSAHLSLEHVEEEYITDSRLNCPKCQSGLLVKRTAGRNTFLGCSHYPMCDYTLNDLDTLKHPIKCNECGDYMVKRYGKRGMFYGCTNYPYCNNTVESKDIH